MPSVNGLILAPSHLLDLLLLALRSSNSAIHFALAKISFINAGIHVERFQFQCLCFQFLVLIHWGFRVFF